MRSAKKANTAGKDYKPEVTVATSAAGGQVVVEVKINGTGIPDAIKEKIMLLSSPPNQPAKVPGWAYR